MKTNEFLHAIIETLLNTIAGGPLKASRLVTTGANQVRLEVRDDSLHTSTGHNFFFDSKGDYIGYCES